MNKRMTPAEAVGTLRDGMTLGIGGWGARRKPMALVREIVRSPLKDLTLVSYGGADVGMLCAAGKVRKLIFAFVTLDLIPLDPHFRAARQSGELSCIELDEGLFQWGLRAAAYRLPFLPARAGLGSDVQRVNPDLKTVRSPYGDGEVLLAMPALELDAAIVHVTYADERGNCQILGPDPYFDDLFAAAAKRCIVSCECVVPTEEFASLGCLHTLRINRSYVQGVVEIPFGAHPTSCPPRYGIDVRHLNAYSATDWATYRQQFVDLDGHDRYVDAVGGGEYIAAVPPPVF